VTFIQFFAVATIAAGVVAMIVRGPPAAAPAAVALIAAGAGMQLATVALFSLLYGARAADLLLFRPFPMPLPVVAIAAGYCMVLVGLIDLLRALSRRTTDEDRED